ncbi:methyltransferase domain-containing protein [Halobacillus amylolyticus]|uniref:Class I SAM-dependent methyltransferase n=1 Tax=Halobacillus amylolyticus TaxID=2932259 RepID=A0ABY4H6P5_9BACI|nr:class I SAM-dependent methyltransferase [Halobacillus amylolyticus]UOR10352.1 class I SAM-dependent methyltransferase [Halobacillus amylolyticus]
MLETGFGPGIALTEFAKNHPAVNLYGIDDSEDILTMALNRLNKVCGLRQICLLHGEGSMIKNVQKMFDRVYSINNVTFWDDDPVYTLKHIRSQMKACGKSFVRFTRMRIELLTQRQKCLGDSWKLFFIIQDFSHIEIMIKQTEPNNTVCAAVVNQ